MGATEQGFQVELGAAADDDPTSEQYGALGAAYDYYNAELFGSALAPVILTFSRRARALAFFIAERWQRSDGTNERRHEIAINPTYLRVLAKRGVFEALVHEMAHAWQEQYGKPPRRNYHDRQFAAKMIEIGLMPSTTGEPGGKQTGQNMCHYAIEGGRFALAFERMPASCHLPWVARDLPPELRKKPPAPGPGGDDQADGDDDDDDGDEEQREQDSKKKRKYSCPKCEANVWGKPSLHIRCGVCKKRFREVG